MPLRNSIEQIVNAAKQDGSEANFNMTELYAAAWQYLESDPQITAVVSQLKELLGAKYYKALGKIILRNVFLIELVKKPKIETTKMRVRWIPELNNDPRGCSYDECLNMARSLLQEMPNWITQDQQTRIPLFKQHNDFNLIPYEGPLDYEVRAAANGRLHTLGNLKWFADDVTVRTMTLRQYLRDPRTSPDVGFFNSVLTDKIKVKTYLTDRVLTGEHKTNREKRWEVNPASVHFAERRVCLAIEYRLITQLCQFEGFPAETVQTLQAQGALPQQLSTALCPITGDPLGYAKFNEEMTDPEHGKSAFHVGHLNPLKLVNGGGARAGHTADNISWISADGNRIQGSLSLNDVRILISRIKRNYDVHGWWPQQN